MRVALLMGNRLNAWHTRMYEPLLGEAVEIRAFTYRPHRYPLEEVRLPFEIVPNKAETRSLPKKIVEGLAARTLGREVDDDPADFFPLLEGFDLIHTWELFTPDTEQALIARKNWNIPVLVTVWDNIPFHRDDEEPFGSRKQRARREADAFLVYTEQSASTLEEEGVDRARIHRVPPAINLNEFFPAENVRTEPPTVLGIGRMVPEKGFEDLLAAARGLAQDSSVPPFRIKLVGAGPLEGKLDRMAQTGGLENRYQRIGGVPYTKVRDLYKEAKVFVLPSRTSPRWKEQFGMAILEAMASGVPVIGAKTGAIPEIVEQAGYLYEEGDVTGLAEGLRLLLTDKEEWCRLREAGLERAGTRFSARENSSKILALYRELIGSGEFLTVDDT